MYEIKFIHHCTTDDTPLYKAKWTETLGGMAVTAAVACGAGGAGGAGLCPVDICVPVVAVLIVAEAPVDVAAVDVTVLDPPAVWEDVPFCSDMALVCTPE